MFKEFFAKDVNNKFFHNQDGIFQHASMIVRVALFVKTTGISDMSAQTVVLPFSTDLQTLTILGISAGVDSVHKRVVVTKLENLQEVAATFKLQKVSSQCAATGSVAANIPSSNVEMTSGVTAADLILFQIQDY